MDSAYIKFNGGIWSEVLKGRYDLGNYKSAARTCENFIPTRYGQVEKRAGTKHLGYAKNNDKACVLHPFQFSVNTKFILEFGERYIRFWSNDLQVEVNPSNWATSIDYEVGNKRENGGKGYVCLVDHTSGTFATDLASEYWYELEASETANFYKLEFPTPYLEAELYELQLRAVNDVVYIVHPNHPVGKLARLADNKWTYKVADLDQPFVDPDVNSTEVVLTPSALTGNITITSNEKVFITDANYVGSDLRLKYLTEGVTSNFSQRYITDADDFDADTYNANDDIVTYSSGAASGTYRVSNTSGNTRLRYDIGTTYECYTVIQNFNFSAWSAGTYSIDDIAGFGGTVYICTVARTPSDTSDPATDTASWNEVVDPSKAPAYFKLGCLALPSQSVFGEWSLKTTGTWRGTWLVQRSIDDGVTWATIRSLTSSNDANYLVEEDQEGEEALIRVLGANYNDGGPSSESVTFTALTTDVYGVATVTARNGNKSVDATVITDMPSTDACVSWQESAFSERQGYPRSISLFDNRLLLAGTRKKPQSFFYSEINSYDNFTATTTLADAPFFVETLSDDQSAVQWLTAQRELFVGTASVEGVLTTRKQDEAQSAENLPIVRWNESMGSAHRPALPMRDSLMVLQRGRTVLNMISYSLEKDGYTGEEVSLLCPQLFSSGVLQMAHLREPYTGAFTVQEDGTLCHMIYEPKLEVTGWCKHTTQNGNFESVAVLPSSGNESSDEDEVWVSLKRSVFKTNVGNPWTVLTAYTIGVEVDRNGLVYKCLVDHTSSSYLPDPTFDYDLSVGYWEVLREDKRFIERFVTGNTAKQEASDADNLWYLDAAVKPAGTGHTTITGLDHLEGETVCVLADGIKGSYIVSGNQITLSVPADTVIVGLPIASEFEPFDLEVQFKGGDTYGKRKQLYDSKLMVWRSLGGSIAHDGQDYQDLIYHAAGETMDESVPLKDGWIEVFHESSYARQKYWRIKHDEPYPFTLQAVIQSFTVSKS